MGKRKWMEAEKKLKRTVVDFFREDEVKIVLFGSRARKDNYAASDADIGIIPYGKIDTKRIALLREKIELLNIPYKVEIVNLLETSPDFKKEALKEAVVWKD
ncbi:MAG: nucleotidyltransferase domain-containing protein [Candidatus Makaraimicrobium thalassicum]|nr:MAG: nucleotidyltransferase domain-containing protein [Candidatus Omnitrophota bacterium]